VTADREVYEWGFIGSEGEQFQLIHTLEEGVRDVKMGAEFNLFLGESG
jgi:hypothetical protein